MARYRLARVPETLSKVKDLKRSLSTGEMKGISGSSYRIYGVTKHYAGIDQRWLLVYSEQAFKREQQSLMKKVQKEQQEAQTALNKLQRKSFNCQTDAKAAANAFAQQCKWHSFEIKLVPINKYKQAGRPAKDVLPTQEGWQVSVQMKPLSTAKASIWVVLS